MGDSDDEYDRKRRDKFRGERSSGGGAPDSYRADRRDDRRGGREEWQDRNPFRGGARTRPDYREYGGRGGGRDRYSPPTKRIRPDWGDDRPRYGGHEGYGIYGWGHEHYPLHGGMHGIPPSLRSGVAAAAAAAAADAANSDLQTQPPMLTLKQFLDTQDDGISDSEVLRKYSEYKLEFKRLQLNEFFVTHKDEEWFKNKYHPEESWKRKEEQLSFLNRRAEVFSELLHQGAITSVTVDTNQSEPLLRLLDTVVIKLEGGTEEDLKILDEKPTEYVRIIEKIEKKVEPDDDVIITDVTNKEQNVETPKIENKPTEEEEEDVWEDNPEKKASPESINEKKRKRSNSESSSSSSTSSSTSSSSSDEEESKKEIEKPVSDKCNDELKTVEEIIPTVEENKDEAIKEVEEKLDENKQEEIVEKDEEKSEEKEEEKDKDKQENGNEIKIENLDDSIKDIDKESPPNNDKPETIDLVKEKETESPGEIVPTGPRALHRTSSIFLRNLAPTITKDEIEAVCKRYDGFLRVAIADPLVERRWFRRGWVTFKRDVNIKEICWNLNNIRLRDCEMGAIVNRDLSRRVRPVNGVTAHKVINRSDIKLCAKIIMNLDEKFQLWTKKSENENGDTGKMESESYGFKTNNPVLQNITDYLIEEASAEEDELLGLAAGITEKENAPENGDLERDPTLISVLDKLVLYLRIVHSVDFYNHCEYPYEDEMPNRCGIIHARGPAPQQKVIQSDIQEYIKTFDGKMTTFLSKSTAVEDEELKSLGAKDPEAEVEKFIQANTQELAKDKWLCPLSGKKFKGPEFIRKHIFNKHGEKVQEVRKEVEYFNNYLRDPKRPQLPENPGNTKKPAPVDVGGHGPYRPGYPMPGYGHPYPTYAPPMIIPPRGGGRGFGGGRRDLPLPGGQDRRVVGYHDLDAPQNFDLFD